MNNTETKDSTENDSGNIGLDRPNAARNMMSSMGGGVGNFHLPDPDEEDDDEHCDIDDEDETLSERLLGLTEMLPEPVRSATGKVLNFTWTSGKWLIHVGRVGLWVFASSATILALPIMFESERTQIEEQQYNQQRQLMLGPNAALGGGHGLGHGGPFPQVSPPHH